MCVCAERREHDSLCWKNREQVSNTWIVKQKSVAEFSSKGSCYFGKSVPPDIGGKAKG